MNVVFMCLGLKIEVDDMKLTDLTDQKQLDYLLRISIMAASICGQGHPLYNNYCFSAYGYLHRMWQVRKGTCRFSNDLFNINPLMCLKITMISIYKIDVALILE